MKPDSETMETIIGCCVEIAEYGALRGKHIRSARRSPSWGSANGLGVCPKDRQNEVWHPIPDSPLA